MLDFRPVIARTLPFAVFLLFLGGNQFLLGALPSTFADGRWLYGVRIAMVALLLFIFWRQYIEINALRLLNARMIWVSVLAGLFVLMLWIVPYPDWAKMQDTTYFDPSKLSGKGLDWVLVVMRWSGAALVVPLMEELFWRSFLMRWLQDKDFLSLNPANVQFFAFAATAGLFATEHSLWLAGLIAGLVYGGLYRHYGTLWAPIIAHVITNGLLGIWVVTTASWWYW